MTLFIYVDRRWKINRSRRNSDDRSFSPFTNGLTPDAAVNEVQRMEKGDRRIDRILITTNLNVDVFGIRTHDSSFVF
jgi:hypothetical protein